MKLLLSFFIFAVTVYAKTPPLSFVALEDGSWHIVVCRSGLQCQEIKTDQEPRTYDYNFSTGNLVYIGSDKNVHFIKDTNETILLKSAKDAYTEPSFVDHGQNIMLVELINGNSKKTKLISINLKDKKQKTLHSQYSTALEPYTNNSTDLYYANVSCVDGCNKIIQEIWHKDLISTEANQLTLLNALSHQPRSNKENSLVYFSSNKGGNFHIWVYDRVMHQSRQLTFGDVTDGFPSPHGKDIFFLRRIANRTAIMHLDEDGDLKEVKLPFNYMKIRNLKVKQ